MQNILLFPVFLVLVGGWLFAEGLQEYAYNLKYRMYCGKDKQAKASLY